MKNSSILLSSTLLLSACSSVLGFFGIHEYVQNPDPNHTHADFAVYVEGEKLDFSDLKYMSGLSTDETTHDEEDEYHHPYLHLHDEVGHVLHTHKQGLTLGTFFSSLGFTMTEQCFTLDTEVMVCPDGGKKWQMFVNAEERPFDPGYVFQDMDKILLTYGADAEEVQKELEAMTDDACKYSKTCPWKGEPPTENCLADPEVPCVAPLE
jgi:hypothetical protein